MEKELMLIGCIFLAGCTIIDIADVPFCRDINVTGTDCHYTGDIFDKGVYNYSNGICKTYLFPYDEHPNIYVCFSTLEDDMQVLKDVIEQCWNCTKKTKCSNAYDCTENMDLEGCSYDGCNYCCNNECTLMECWEEPKNISKLNMTWAVINPKPANEQIPKDYVQITIYETNCQCMDRIRWCDNWDCDCDDYYCYNQSKVIYVPKNNSNREIR